MARILILLVLTSATAAPVAAQDYYPTTQRNQAYGKTSLAHRLAEYLQDLQASYTTDTVTDAAHQLRDYALVPNDETEFESRAYDSLDNSALVTPTLEGALQRIQNARDLLTSYMDEQSAALADTINNFSGTGRSPQSLATPATPPNQALSQEAYDWRYGKQERGTSGFMHPPQTSSPSDFNIGSGGYAPDGSYAIR